MRKGQNIILAVLMAGLAGIGLAAAPSASAQVYRQNPCANGNMEILRGSYTQCFSWDGVRSGSYLPVNDWYDHVRAGIYHLTVSWHDTRTGAWYAPSAAPWQTLGQPTSDCILYSITFN
jgi:hypothetical protein